MIAPTTVSPNCHDCRHYRQTMVFDLCGRTESTYFVAGKADQHTTGHMRRHECGPDGKLFESVTA